MCSCSFLKEAARCPGWDFQGPPGVCSILTCPLGAPTNWRQEGEGGSLGPGLTVPHGGHTLPCLVTHLSWALAGQVVAESFSLEPPSGPGPVILLVFLRAAFEQRKDFSEILWFLSPNSSLSFQMQFTNLIL